jgi:hypothetical protein
METLCREPLLHGVAFFNAFIDGRAPVGFGDCSFVPPEGLLLRFCDLVGDVSGRKQLEQALTDYLEFQNAGRNGFRYIWNQPREAQALLYMQGNSVPLETEQRVVQHFPDTGWASLRNGRLLLGFRAGDNTGSHSMRDQLAVNLAMEGVSLLRYTENHPYTAGWFDVNNENTRDLYFEAQSVSKNTILINGIGQIRKGRVELEPIEDGASAEAGGLYPSFVESVRRSVQLNGEGFRLVDLIKTREICYHEIRFFSDGQIETGEGGTVRITAAGKVLNLNVTCEIPLKFVVAWVFPSIGIRDGWRMLRVVTREPVLESTITTTIGPVFP